MAAERTVSGPSLKITEILIYFALNYFFRFSIRTPQPATTCSQDGQQITLRMVFVSMQPYKILLGSCKNWEIGNAVGLDSFLLRISTVKRVKVHYSRSYIFLESRRIRELANIWVATGKWEEMSASGSSAHTLKWMRQSLIPKRKVYNSLPLRI
jgi:hypothetical protein